MPGQLIGPIVATVFGLVYVEVNAGRLPPVVGWPLRIVGLVLLVVLSAMVVLKLRRGTALRDPSVRGRELAQRTTRLGAGFAVITVTEAVALVGGAILLTDVLDRPEAVIAWVSVVVGLHFFPLARHVRMSFFTVLGVLITVCGVVAMVVALTTGADPVIAFVGGVLPGFILLGFAVWGISSWSPEARPT